MVALLDAVETLTHGMVDIVGFATDFIEQTCGLSSEQVIFVLFLQSLALALLSLHFQTKSVFLNILTVIAVGGTGIAIECRVPFLKGEVLDVGHEVLEPILSSFSRNVHVSLISACLNTMLCFAIAGYSLYQSINGRANIVVKGAVSISIRMMIGLLTRLPVPSKFEPVSGDWPPSKPGVCDGFIFNPSGHVLAAVLVSLDLRHKGRFVAASAVDAINLVQAVRLVALRGHYVSFYFCASSNSLTHISGYTCARAVRRCHHVYSRCPRRRSAG